MEFEKDIPFLSIYFLLIKMEFAKAHFILKVIVIIN